MPFVLLFDMIVQVDSFKNWAKMASSSAKTSKNNRAFDNTGVFVFNFLDNDEDCPPGAIDPRLLICQTDGCCNIAEICDTNNLESDTVKIGDVWYYTWRPKGIVDDILDDLDPGVHLHLSCNIDQVGIRINLSHIVDVLESVSDELILSEICNWLFKNCFESEQFYDWLCNTIINECFKSPDFISKFILWFTNIALEDPRCKKEFIDFVLNNENLTNSLCNILVSCFDNQDIVDIVCELLNEVLSEQEIKDVVCDNLVESIASQDSLSSKICKIITGCVNSENWNSEDSESDPSGAESGESTYLIDEISGCVTHIAIDGVWVCIGVTEDEEPPPPDVEITGSKYGPSYSDFSPFTPVCDPSGATGTMTAPNISTSSDGFCDDDVQAGTYPSMQEQLNEYHTIVVSNATQNLEVCFDIEGGGGNTIDVFLLDSSNTALPFASASGGNNAAISSSFQCGHQGASFSIAPFAQPQTTTANMCFVINSVPPGTYTFVINAIRGLAPRCTRNFTVTSI